MEYKPTCYYQPIKKSQKEKFTEIIEERIDEYSLIHLINNIQQNPIKSRIELVDQAITSIFNTMRKKIEEINQGVLYSTVKAKVRECIAIQKAVIRNISNKEIDKENCRQKLRNEILA